MKRLWSRNSIELHEARDGTRTVFYRYQHNGTPHLDSVGSFKPGPDRDKEQRQLVSAAKTKLKGVRGEIAAAKADGKTWQHPDDLARAARDTAATELGARRELRLDVSVPVYLDERADLYSRPKEHRAHFVNILHYFPNAYADKITRLQVRQYHAARCEATGVFAGRKPIGPRQPSQEVSALSVFVDWLVDLGHPIDNPCIGFRRRSRVDGDSGKPKHKAIVPTPEALEAILTVSPAPPAHYKANGRANHAIRWTRNRALWTLAYFLGGPRPESELCRLRWQDVIFPDADAARFGGGRVTLRGDKTGARTIPMHPRAEVALRSILPTDPDPASYVFHKRGKPLSPWTRNSYPRAWAETLAEVGKRHGGLEGMWLRNMRQTAISYMRDAGTDRTIAGKVAGNSAPQNDQYIEANDTLKRAAIDSLSTGTRVLTRVLGGSRANAK